MYRQLEAYSYSSSACRYWIYLWTLQHDFDSQTIMCVREEFERDLVKLDTKNRVNSLWNITPSSQARLQTASARLTNVAGIPVVLHTSYLVEERFLRIILHLLIDEEFAVSHVWTATQKCAISNVLSISSMLVEMNEVGSIVNTNIESIATR